MTVLLILIYRSQTVTVNYRSVFYVLHTPLPYYDCDTHSTCIFTIIIIYGKHFVHNRNNISSS